MFEIIHRVVGDDPLRDAFRHKFRNNVNLEMNYLNRRQVKTVADFVEETIADIKQSIETLVARFEKINEKLNEIVAHIAEVKRSIDESKHLIAHCTNSTITTKQDII
jgi:peptidoglycan hydrolase CwlO-like protein